MVDTSFRRQFQLKRLKLSHRQRALFTTSSFLSEGNFLIAKLLLFGWTLGFLLTSASESATEPKWQIYLTNWSFTVQVIYHLLGVMVTVKGMIDHQKEIEEHGTGVAYTLDKHTTYLHSVYWLFFDINSVTSLTVTFDFYTLLKPDNGLISTTSHATTSVTTIIDLFIINVPVHILHFVYPFAYACIYSLFSLIYWASGGTNVQGKPYIYPVLDWEGSPGIAAACVLGTLFIVGPLAQLVIFGAWRLRLALCEWLFTVPIRVFEMSIHHPDTMEMSRSQHL